jgi:hypothetical protein
MFVYRKGKLKEEPIFISKTEFIYRLSHQSSGMVIEVKYDPTAQAGDVNKNPYKVFKEVNGTYTIYEEFYARNKSIKENFEEAIAFFEDNIYKALNETPPQQQQQPKKPTTPPKKVKEVPVVGDIIQVKNNYGIVTEVVDSKVIVRKLSKEEALRILKNKQNQQISIAKAEQNN